MIGYCVLSPQDIQRDKRMERPTLYDWSKLGRLLKGTWPRPIPPYLLANESNLDEVEEWLREAESAPFIAIDTEYIPDSKLLQLIGVGYPGCKQGLMIPWIWGGNGLVRWARETLTPQIKRLVGLVPSVFQNFLGAELPILRHNLEIEYEDYKQVDDLCLAHAVLYSEFPHDLEFLASIYGQYPKLKHLSKENLVLYCWGDVLSTIDGWEGIEPELVKDPLSKQVYESQSLKLIPIIDYRHEKGIKVNKARVEQASRDYAAKLDHSQLRAWAYCGWPINLGSPKQLAHWLYEVEGLPVQKNKETRKPTVDDDAISVLKGKYEDHSLILARADYAEAKQADSHYIQPLTGRDRCFPQILIHAQSSGRHSTNDPPLAQLPGDLRDILEPDPGSPWLGWDWDQIELRILASLAGDQLLLDAFKNGWDIHTINFCDIFAIPYPPNLKNPHSSPECQAWRDSINWEGKDDKRRRFAKVFVYRLHYRGEAKTATDIPGAKGLGLDGPRLVQGSIRYLGRHPAIKSYWDRCDRLANTTRVSRTFLGRRRVLLGDGKGLLREASNHPMQGAVSDVYNLTIVAIKEACPEANFVYGMHDSQWWEIPQASWDEYVPKIKAIVEKEWVINGQSVILPASFKTRE
jgi:DNA polymerase I-like protein with 3'-5' exonuclease and polymerase domains